MKRVYKYSVPMKDKFYIEMPKGAEILCVQVQHERPHIWALVDPSEEIQRFIFRLAGTGGDIDDKLVLKYIGTFQMDDGIFIGHLFLET